MRATLLHPVSLVAVLAASFVICGSRPGLAQTADAQLCIFLDRSYSEGATVCPQTRFMLMCSAEGSKLVWKTVSDRSLAERCLRPTTTGDIAEPVRPRWQRIARSLPPPPPAPLPAASTSAKCFVFNGKRYCE